MRFRAALISSSNHAIRLKYFDTTRKVMKIFFFLVVWILLFHNTMPQNKRQSLQQSQFNF